MICHDRLPGRPVCPHSSFRPDTETARPTRHSDRSGRQSAKWRNLVAGFRDLHGGDRAGIPPLASLGRNDGVGIAPGRDGGPECVMKCHDLSCSAASIIETDRSIFRVFFRRRAVFPTQNPQKSAVSVPEVMPNKNKVCIISQIADIERPRSGGTAAAPERRLWAGVMKCHASSGSGFRRSLQPRPSFRPERTPVREVEESRRRLPGSRCRDRAGIPPLASLGRNDDGGFAPGQDDGGGGREAS